MPTPLDTPPCNHDLGDVFPRLVYFFTASWCALLKKIEGGKILTIFERESDCEHRLEQEQE